MEKKLDAAAARQILKDLRRSIEHGPPEKLDAEAILQTLAEIRRSVPGIEAVSRHVDGADGRCTFHDGTPVETELDFDHAAVAEAAYALAEDIHAAVEKQQARLYERALQIYYAAEEAARDPANADLIPYLEEMRAAHQREFGTPIPPRKEDSENDPCR